MKSSPTPPRLIHSSRPRNAPMALSAPAWSGRFQCENRAPNDACCPPRPPRTPTRSAWPPATDPLAGTGTHPSGLVMAGASDSVRRPASGDATAERYPRSSRPHRVSARSVLVEHDAPTSMTPGWWAGADRVIRQRLVRRSITSSALVRDARRGSAAPCAPGIRRSLRRTRPLDATVGRARRR